RLDALAERLPRALRANAQIHHTRFSRIAARSSPAALAHRVRQGRNDVTVVAARCGRAMIVLRALRGERFETLQRRFATCLRANLDAHRRQIVRDCERAAALAE